jgi:hypothetical protein
LDGTTERAKATQARWAKKAKSVKPSDRDIRWLEFFIRETEKYDIHVGGLNILETLPIKPLSGCKIIPAGERKLSYLALKGQTE